MTTRERSPLETEIDNYESRIDQERDHLIRVFLENVQREMDRINFSRSDIALLLNLNRSQVSKLFNRPGNPTLHTLVALASAIDHEVQFQIKPRKPREQSGYANVVPPEQWLTWLSNDDVETSGMEWSLAGSNR